MIETNPLAVLLSTVGAAVAAASDTASCVNGASTTPTAANDIYPYFTR